MVVIDIVNQIKNGTALTQSITPPRQALPATPPLEGYAVCGGGKYF